jgi:hypothetical protein
MLAAVVTIPTVMRLASIRPMPPRIMWLTRKPEGLLANTATRHGESPDELHIERIANRPQRPDPHTRSHTTKRVITPKHWRRGTRLAALPGLPLADRAIGEMAYMSLKRSFWEVQTASLWPGSVDEPTA